MPGGDSPPRAGTGAICVDDLVVRKGLSAAAEEEHAVYRVMSIRQAARPPARITSEEPASPDAPAGSGVTVPQEEQEIRVLYVRNEETGEEQFCPQSELAVYYKDHRKDAFDGDIEVKGEKFGHVPYTQSPAGSGASSPASARSGRQEGAVAAEEQAQLDQFLADRRPPPAQGTAAAEREQLLAPDPGKGKGYGAARGGAAKKDTDDDASKPCCCSVQ